MKPTLYGPLARLSDWYHGWRDGWAEIPSPVAHGALDRPVTTPHRDALIRRAQDAFEHERLRYEADRTRVLAHRTAASAFKPHIQDRAARAEERLAAVSALLSPEERTRRRLGEERRDDRIVVTRRLREQEQRIRAAQAAVQDAHAELASLDGQIAATSEEADRCLSAAAARVRRIHEHTHRRLAAYRRRLVRTHPHGAWVNDVLSSPSPEIPGWALLGPPAPLPSPAPRPLREEQPQPEEPPARRLIPLGDVTVFGSDPVADVVLDAVAAAPHHFTLRREGGRYLLSDHGHGHGPYIAGQPVKSAMLSPGDCFDFADHRYRISQDGSGLEDTPLGGCALIVAEVYAKSGDKPRLTRMSFVQRDNTLLAILGPSGAGKSSLFSALLGELETDGGELFFRGLDLKTHARQIREQLGFVPQEIELYQTLTVRRLLQYSTWLRSPWRRPERNRRVEEVCAQLGLETQIDQLVATLSGGQRRRVSIALELLTKPRLLMLDEPASGLDPGMDRELMTLLREYADDGNTVIVITHATDHLDRAGHVLVVVRDGRPVYSGPPALVRSALGAASYADLMKSLADDPLTPARRYAAGSAASEAVVEAERAKTSPAVPPPMRRRGPARTFARQLWVLILRQISLLAARGASRNRSDDERKLLEWTRRSAVVLMPFIIAGVSAVLAGLVTGESGLGGGDAAPTALSLLTTLCVLSGQALTYSDIVSDYPIIRRERRTGTLTLAVTLSRWLIYAAVAVAEALLITVLFLRIRPGPTRSLVLWPAAELFVNLAAVTVAAMSMGLLISVVARKLEQAVALVTATSVAQIALNGITADLSGNRVLTAVAALLPDRWGVAAAASSLDLRALSALGTPKDALWRHDLHQWLFDLAALGVVTLACFAGATLWLSRRLSRSQ
ncbi:ATP-binding cassette domain-containing protein [Nonomuraea sp. SYSU D8015]|uniref:ATP-binding cassette domain-containing protein n=1 Tax=Nonomuraea sp. SYSU D8015 TaxID=2593644 RepID=UPI0016611322|nr:ATP-binding cassette domain-containing protein [Nonomuraea sp. SYSU D8015]